MFHLHYRVHTRSEQLFAGILCALMVLFIGTRAVRAQSWQTLARLPQIVNCSFFFDTSMGFAGSGATYGAPNSRTEPINIYRTTNGGLSWSPMVVPQGYLGSVSSIFMVDHNNGWASILPWNSSQNNRLWQTTDGGLTWGELATSGMGTCVYQTSHALILTDLDDGHQGCISTDGGHTFTNSIPGGTNCIGFLNDTDGIITVFRGGPWQQTTDGGLTWNPLSLGEESWGIGPVPGTSTYYCAGENVPTLVTKSTDKGITWTTLHSFPFETSGDIRVADSETLYVQVNSNIAPNLATGVLRSTDGGINWTNLGGPQNFNDSRFTVIPLKCGAMIYAFDTGGGAFKLVDIFKHVAEGLVLNTKYDVVASSCQPLDTTVNTGIIGCLPTSGLLDSLWLSGSLAFALADTRSTPRSLAPIDSVLISYAGTSGGADTAELHIRYDLGSGIHDTTILLTGTMASPLLAQPARLHREAASAYLGGVDSLELGMDLGAQINLDSLWPYLNDIEGTFAFDSSIVSFESYTPPAGWTITTLANHGDAVDFGIHKISGQATQPLDLGAALFLPNTTQLATSWVTLPRFVLNIGKQAISLCVTDNEDSHWSVKTLGAQSGVTEAPTAAGDGISIYPNPAESEFFVRNTNAHPALITLYDAIGRNVASANVGAASTSTIDIASLARGSYVVVCHVGDRMVVRRLDKSR